MSRHLHSLETSRTIEPPTPRYADDAVRELSIALESAYRRKAEIVASGGDASAVAARILELRRQLREGAQLRAGDMLTDGRYLLLEPIGQGGFARVWKAYDGHTHSLVAVKVLHGQYAADRTRRERFFRGARQMARLQHPGIVRVFEQECREDGYFYFVMEYIGGGDFRQAILGGRLSMAERLRVVIEAGDALAFAHSRGVIHRDVKPGNILLDLAGQSKLTDFDLVRAVDTIGGTRTAGMLGTFLYAAPEVLTNARHATAKADIYGLGMTAIFAFHGTDLPPEVFRDPSAFIARLDMNEYARQVLAQSVAWDSSERWDSVAEFCRALDRAVDPTIPDGLVVQAKAGDVAKLGTPWAPHLFERLEGDGAGLIRVQTADEGRWLIQIRVPEKIREVYGTASEMLLLATAGEVRGEDLKKAQEELQRREYDLDPDLLVVLDGHPRLEERLREIFQLWGQWVPWPYVDGNLPPLAEQFRIHLPAYDIFEQKDPVRGRQVIGRGDLVADISRRLRGGQSLGVFGLRKIGKTTLVRAVTDKLDPVGAMATLPRKSSRSTYEPVTVPVIWLDVQELVPRTLGALVVQLARDLEERLALEGIDLPAFSFKDNPLAEFNQLLEAALKEACWPLCFVFDEYDLLFQSSHGEPGIPEIDQFLRMLRAHAQKSRRVSLVVVGRDSEFLDRPEMNGRPNPMLNWFVTRWLGPMNSHDADELLRRLGRRVGLAAGERTTRLARRWTGGHPLLHRQLGSALLELSRGKSREGEHVPTDPFCEEAIELFLDRDAVLTNCRDVYFLLGTRYPDAATFLHELSLADAQSVTTLLDECGGWHQSAIRTLRKFGLILGTPDRPSIPELFRWYSQSVAPDFEKIAV